MSCCEEAREQGGGRDGERKLQHGRNRRCPLCWKECRCRQRPGTKIPIQFSSPHPWFPRQSGTSTRHQRVFLSGSSRALTTTTGWTEPSSRSSPRWDNLLKHKNSTPILKTVVQTHCEDFYEQICSTERQRQGFWGAIQLVKNEMHVAKAFYFLFFGAFGSLFPLLAVYFKVFCCYPSYLANIIHPPTGSGHGCSSMWFLDRGEADRRVPCNPLLARNLGQVLFFLLFTHLFIP